MSKLAHSCDETMEQIEMQRYGLRPLSIPPKPRCHAKTPVMWFRPKGGRCCHGAKWRAMDGKKYCTVHARMLPEIDDGDRS